MKNSSAHVQGRRQLHGLGYQVYVIQHLPTCIMIMNCNPHVHSVSAHGEFISYRLKVVSSLPVHSQDFRDE